MKITKYIHSCLLAETDNRVGLFDPGIFSYKSGLFKLDRVDRIDRIIITHKHPDHCHPDFIAEVVTKFPEAHIVANQSVQQVLKQAGIDAMMREETGCTQKFAANHEPIEPLGDTPPNTGYHFKDYLTHPGDSHSFNETKTVLAMPFVAPWGTVMNGINKVLKLKPKAVFGIHDWHYGDEARDWLNTRLANVFRETEIEFVPVKNGQPTEV